MPPSHADMPITIIMKCVTTPLTVRNQCSKSSIPRTPKCQSPPFCLQPVFLSPSDSGQSTRSQSPCNSLDVTKSSTRFSLTESENRCPNTDFSKPPRSQVVIYRKSTDTLTYTQLAQKLTQLETEHSQVLTLCDSLLADLEQTREECQRLKDEGSRLNSALEQANERINALTKKVLAKSSSVSSEENEGLISSNVAVTLVSELE